MAKRIATILAPEDLGASGTKVISVDIRDVISRISFVWKCTVVTVSAMLDSVLSAISKVELVDGSDVLFSLSGMEAQALNFFDRREMPQNDLSLTVGGYHVASFSIDFGRYLWDRELAFDPKKFVNPQLRITWDEDAANTAVVVNSFQVYAHIFEGEDVSPIGFLSAKEFYQYLMAASGAELIEVPRDEVLRGLMIRGWSTDHDPIALFDTLKLSEDNDRRVPLDIKANDYERILRGLYPRIREYVTLDAAVTAKTIYAVPSLNSQIQINYDATAFVTAQSKFAAETWTGHKLALSASVDIKALNGVISGHLPHNCLPVLFGRQDVIEDWYNLAEVGGLKLKLTASSDADSGDITSIVTQQMRKY